MDARLWVPILGIIITGTFSVFVALISKQNKPVRDILKSTKIQGNGSLVEAIGILQRQREKDQNLFEEQIKFYRAETIAARKEAREARERADNLEDELNELKVNTNRQITAMKKKLEEHDIELHPK